MLQPSHWLLLKEATLYTEYTIRAYDMSALGIDVVSVHKLFAYRVMSTFRIDVVSGHMK